MKARTWALLVAGVIAATGLTYGAYWYFEQYYALPYAGSVTFVRLEGPPPSYFNLSDADAKSLPPSVQFALDQAMSTGRGETNLSRAEMAGMLGVLEPLSREETGLFDAPFKFKGQYFRRLLVEV